MLPVVRGEDVTRNHIAAYTTSLVLITLMIVIYGGAGIIFLITGIILSGYFTYCAFSLRKTKSESEAWNLFKFSNIYLYSLFICLVIDSIYLINL